MSSVGVPARTRRKADKTPYVLLAPAMVMIVLILILPIIISFAMSLTDANLLTWTKGNFIGVNNYIAFLQSESFFKVIRATFIFVGGGVVFTYIIGLGVALLLNNHIRFRFLFRGIIIIPWVVPQVVLVLVWRWMINPQYGVVNWFLSSIGLLPQGFSWLTSPQFAILTLLFITVWRQYPLATIILLAGMKTIPDELYAAASVDGANSLQTFYHITRPGLRYVSSVLVLLLTIWSFGNFIVIWLMTMGGPADNTAILTIWSYLNAFKFNKLGYGAAIGIICLLISLVISILYYQFVMKRLDK
jgi:multiple sugar transport system permease protein